MKPKCFWMLSCGVIAIAFSFLLSTSALAAYSGYYSGTMTYGNSQFATGDHNSSYPYATVSVNSGCSDGGTFWYEQVGGGRCTTIATVSPRVTKTFSYTKNFSGGVQLWGTSSGSGSHSVSGSWRSNVK